MSLPPGFLDELRTRLSLTQVVGRKVMWDNKKSNQGKGDMWAPCPFHQEKSASFHVDDRKGFYYCFGCHAKGDAISFVRETENVDFMEAVKILADEAGLPMPERDPRAQEKADTRSELADVMEQAVQHFRLNLNTSNATDARAYLERRGLNKDALARWDIGFAPDNGGVLAALTAKGVPVDQIIAAGLAAKSDRGGAPYDRFRGRIMFPIRDARGRAIAFGGRAMDPNAKAKYYNSPETELFDKSRTLYNVQKARTAAGKGQPLIVSEGYMDVIALAEAGFEAAVAPLGTAVTEHHLHMLWRIAPEPIIALDGDTAGLRAAMRTIDLALPLLVAGQSLRFAMMPAGMDPDDVLKQQGKQAMQDIIDAAIPMVQLLWQRETEGKVFDSPERKAALDKTLREKIKQIVDPSIRSHYGEAIKEMRWDLFRTRKPQQGGKAFTPRKSAAWNPKQQPWERDRAPVASNRSSALGAGIGDQSHMREAVVLATLIATPAVLPKFIAALELMDCSDPNHVQMRNAILRAPDGADLRAALEQELGHDVVASLVGNRMVQITSGLCKPGDTTFAASCLTESFAKLAASRAMPREEEEARYAIDAADESLTWRIRQAKEALDNSDVIASGSSAEMVVAENGATLDSEQLKISRALWESLTIAKPGGDPK
ncbi:DNA primase [Loktanella salsilacus]|jgi:DNA primase|uniref:DNA primase n=1 Tax=Loktanella salsilacus TaxID=195913 RepID=A0A1I4FSU6_9RHOB|nr:DNA primase [Loktanella salsilacus]MBU0780282.1 DNA primase [Alphaproteobacteria bacterium]UTH47284.1 DNA primase [Loktanella salsilacus]SFL19866.1 DNA primase [Loktanella salsilacus]